jgi:hypothetical protein
MRVESVAKCKACGAEIMWLRTNADKAMPVDVEPDEGGNLVIEGFSVRVVDLFTPAEAERYMPHWATCPNAKEFKS